MELFEILAYNIIEIYDIKGEKIIGDFKVDFYKSKYSSYNGNTIRLFLNSEPLPREGFKVKYKCKCGSENIILLLKYLKRDVNTSCTKCRECDTKRIKQSEYMKKTLSENGKIIKKNNRLKNNKLTLEEELLLSEELFNIESEDFKKNYFNIHTTIDELENHRKSIVSINGVCINKLKFIPYKKIKNHTKYTQYIVDENNNLLRFSNIVYNCNNCLKTFTSSNRRLPKEKLSKLKILCKDCSLCNNSFKIRNCENITNERIVYQSSPELKLINFCNSNNIIIINGPYIEYFFKSKKRTYRVDFLINDILIEIKDNHVWHKRQLETGQWHAKEKAALDYCNDNNKKYMLIFTNELPEFLETLRYSLGLGENLRS